MTQPWFELQPATRQANDLTTRLRRQQRKQIEGSQPEWRISTIYHAWDAPFWLGTLEIQQWSLGTLAVYINTAVEYNIHRRMICTSGYNTTMWFNNTLHWLIDNCSLTSHPPSDPYERHWQWLKQGGWMGLNNNSGAGKKPRSKQNKNADDRKTY